MTKIRDKISFIAKPGGIVVLSSFAVIPPLHHPWWQVVLIVVGAISIIAIFLALFFMFGDSTEKEWATEIHPVNSDDFIKAISGLSNSPVEQGGGITILNNGNEFLPAFINAVRNAKQSINFSAYIWSDGKMSDMVIPELLDRARAGVEVRILLDGFGGYGAPSDKFNELKKAGVQVEIFRAPKFGKLMRLHRRNHRRAIVMDGQTGFTGGMAIADHWLGNAENPDQWRDNMFQVYGKMAQSLQAGFAQLWTGTCGEILVGDKFYPPVKPHSEGPTCRYINLLSSPAAESQPLPRFFWLSVACAQKSIYINSSYFVPDTHLRDILIDRAKAGVEVRILVPSNKTDAVPIRLAGHHYYKTLLEAGIKIYEYQPTMIHSKIMVIDGQWSVIGSANMDIRSILLNEENIMGILNTQFAEKLQTVFHENLKKAKRVELRSWKNRTIFVRPIEWFCARFAKQY